MTASSAPALLTGKLKTINKQDIVTAAQKAASRFTAKPAAAKATAQPTAATSTSAQVAPAYNTAYSAAPMPSPVPIEAPPQSQAAYMQGGYQSSQQLAAQQLATQPMAPPQYDQISQMNSLQTNNQQLQAQLSQANSYIQQLQSRNAPAQSMPPQMMPSQQVMASQQAMPSQQVIASQQLMTGQQMGQPSGSLRLLLQGVKAAKDDVQLKVLLINETGQEIKLPSNLKASVRSASQGERQGKASFSGKTVNPGASVAGTIKIAGSNLDPTADVVIPASSLAVVGMGDLHLTVPISQR
jgi:hypothetical protein